VLLDAIQCSRPHPCCPIASAGPTAGPLLALLSQGAPSGLASARHVRARPHPDRPLTGCSQAPGTYDRILSVEMFEHMKNYQELMRRCSSWLRPGGALFVHIFCHRSSPYHFEVGTHTHTHTPSACPLCPTSHTEAQWLLNTPLPRCTATPRPRPVAAAPASLQHLTHSCTAAHVPRTRHTHRSSMRQGPPLMPHPALPPQRPCRLSHQQPALP